MRNISIHGWDGAVWNLTSETSAVRALPNQVVWGTAPARIGQQNRIGIPGSRISGRKHAPRDMLIPIVIHGTADEVDQIINGLAVTLDPLRYGGQVTIQVDSNGRSRQIDAVLTGGLDGLTMPDCDAVMVETDLVFRAMHPYWRDTVAIEIDIIPPAALWGQRTAYNEPQPYDAAIPYRGVDGQDLLEYNEALTYNLADSYNAGSQAIVTVEVTNPGEVMAYPVVTAVGPSGQISVTDLADLRFWTYRPDVPDGSELYVRSQPGQPTVLLDGELAAGGLADGSRPFGIEPQQTRILQVEQKDRTVASSLSIAFTPEYLTC